MNFNTPLTICMFSNLYPPVYSGSSSQCSGLARQLTQRGFRVIVITARVDMTGPEHEVLDGVLVYRLPALKLPRMRIALNFPWLSLTFTLSNIRRIREILAAHPPDLIHLHNHMFDTALHAVIVAGRLKIPLVITIHTIIRHPNRFYDNLLRVLDKFLLKFLVIRKAEVLICPDNIIAKYAAQTFGSKNIILIPYGIDQLPDPDPAKMLELRNKYDLGAGPVILSIGHLHEIRNRRELIEILPQLLTRFPGLKVLIVGDIGTHSAKILASKLEVLDHVIFTGAVPHSEVSNYLGIADLEAHWFDSTHPHKSLGIAAQEAMSAGKVVVAVADKDVYGEGVLRDGENVVLVDSTDLKALAKRITEILEDKQLQGIIGARARQTIHEHFEWDSICDQIIQTYHAVLREYATARALS